MLIISDLLYIVHNIIDQMFRNEAVSEFLNNVVTPDGTYIYDGAFWRHTFTNQ